MRREYPKVPGPGRRILITLLVLGALLVGADAAMRSVAEGRLASSVQRSLGLPERPELELQGFPFLVQVVRGRIDGVDIELTDVTIEDVPFRTVTLQLDDIRFDRMALIRGSGSASARAGTAQAVLTQESLSRLLQDAGTPVLVKLPGPGIRVSTRVSAGGATTTATAEGRIGVESGRLVFSPSDVDVEGTVGVPAAALAFDLPLPELIPGLEYRRVLVHDGVAAIEASLESARLDL